MGEVPYVGSLVVGGKKHFGFVSFSFEIVDQLGVVRWRHSSDPEDLVDAPVSNGRYSVILGGEGMNPLPPELFTDYSNLSLRVHADAGDGSGLLHLLPDHPIRSIASAHAADRATLARRAKLADGLASGSVGESALSAALSQKMATANNSARLAPANLSAALRAHFANDLKPKLAVTANSSEIFYGFSVDKLDGLQCWHSALVIEGNPANGDAITKWNDLSGKGRHFENVSGDPRLVVSSKMGKPVVAFDGNDLMWTNHNLDHLVNTGYTIVSLARYVGHHNSRVVSSRTRNFLFGFHGGRIERWYADGWIHDVNRIDSEWHLHVGTIEAKGGDPAASFWLDGELLVADARGSSDNTFAPGVLQLGGWLTNREMSACEVAEIIIFDRQLNLSERIKIEGRLAHKWNLSEHLLSVSHPYFSYNPFREGESTVLEAPAATGKNLSYAWKKNGQVIQDANGSTLTVTGEVAEYLVVASNLFGSSEHAFSITSVPPLSEGNGSAPAPPDVSQLIRRNAFATYEHTLFIDENGSLWAVGRGDNGRLGLGNSTHRSTPEKVVDGGVASVFCYSQQSFFIKEDGSLWGMGWNGYGQLGDGTKSNRNKPIKIVDAGVIEVAPGNTHTLFLKHDGSLWAMGRNNNGQLGDGTTTTRVDPVKILDGNVSRIAAWHNFNLVLKTDGSLWSFGRNNQGQLGDGTLTDRNASVQVVDANVTAIACGYEHGMFLKADGSAWAFGWNGGEYRLGDGTSNRRTSPVKILDANVTAISAGSTNSFFLKNDDSLWGVGLARFSVLGIDSVTNPSTPIRIVEGAKRISAGAHSLLYEDDAGRLRGLGRSVQGHFADGAQLIRHEPFRALDANVSGISAANNHAAILKSDGSLWTMGMDWDGRLGNGGNDRDESSPVLAADANVSHVSTGLYHTLFLKSDGSLWGFGDNNFGKLGLGNMSDKNVPTLIVDANVTACAGGDQHSLFVKADGSLWAMGRNHRGQLGDANASDQKTPIRILDANVSQVSAGYEFSLFLKTDGSVWSMGSNSSYRLGYGGLGDRSEPVLVMASGAIAIEAGHAHSLILRSDGSLWAFGSRSWGRLGEGYLSDRNVPVKIVEYGVVSISAGNEHSLFVKADGSLWGMGRNSHGQLGIPNESNHLRPVRILASGAAEVSCGSHYSLVRMQDGSLLSFGYDHSAQLGTGRMVRTHVPVTITEDLAQ
jgi:alpha-tubulin suppressor-like RCC1 family protein